MTTKHEMVTNSLRPTYKTGIVDKFVNENTKEYLNETQHEMLISTLMTIKTCNVDMYVIVNNSWNVGMYVNDNNRLE